MQLKVTLLPFLVSVFALVSQQAVAAPSPIGAFVPAGNDTRPVIRADHTGKLQDSLVNERGELLTNPRIVLESRQSPAFPYGSKKVSQQPHTQPALENLCLNQADLSSSALLTVTGSRSQYWRLASSRTLDHP